MSIIQDPIQAKGSRPDPPAFKRPTLADLRAPSPDEPVTPPDVPSTPAPPSAPTYARPSLSDLREVDLNFTLNQKTEPQYKPHTVEEYRELQMMQDAGDRGGLGPSLDEEWERKQQIRARVIQFGQKISQENKCVIPKRTKPRSEAQKTATKRDKMRDYAHNIPKPKLPLKGKIPDLKPRSQSVPAEARYDIEAELQRHEHFVRRITALTSIISEFLD
jgi:hypothetical protein